MKRRFSGEGTEALYREHAGKPVIELELKSLLQLFDSFDPAPFREKDLDPEAEEYIYNAVDEFPLKKPLEIMIHLPSTEVSAEIEADLKVAIKNHFSYKKLLTEIELKRLLDQGRKNFIIALTFLFLCLLVIRLLATFEESLVNTLFSEGLLIIGWVAMWEPVHIFLYGWWPIVHKRNIYEKITHMDVYIGTGSQAGEKAPGYLFTSKKSPD
ncbi:hypothetical protein MSHOH_1876 [Methanosarcina horonobensis HB-1 = JCM 15518]|uniref:Uncharacterized protein n=1 Tax=Methanosarcina horonobensis HB-1 = JCM 15518 TaxID=1434110 RepID=A0A0E3S9S5_9EURY|nr:hypothetical protein [Methanosarcina horonobensis]AKB78359.1 hypothetical protein MSHOH_1876 [Methanosarcina horonobensis HB-1 = JCM 15518]